MIITILGDLILAYLALVALVVFGVALSCLVSPLLPELPSVDYADDFATRLSGSDGEPDSSSHAPSDPDIVFASAPTRQRRAGLAAAHPTTHTPTRKEADHSDAFTEIGFHSGAAASHPHLRLVP